MDITERGKKIVANFVFVVVKIRLNQRTFIGERFPRILDFLFVVEVLFQECFCLFVSIEIMTLIRLFFFVAVVFLVGFAVQKYKIDGLLEHLMCMCVGWLVSTDFMRSILR